MKQCEFDQWWMLWVLAGLAGCVLLAEEMAKDWAKWLQLGLAVLALLLLISSAALAVVTRGPWKHTVWLTVLPPRDDSKVPAVLVYGTVVKAETEISGPRGLSVLSFFNAPVATHLKCALYRSDGTLEILQQPEVQNGIARCPGASPEYQQPEPAPPESEPEQVGLNCQIPLVGLENPGEELGLVHCGKIPACRQAVAHLSGSSDTAGELQFVLSVGSATLDDPYKLSKRRFSFHRAVNVGEPAPVSVNLRVLAGRFTFTTGDILTVTDGPLPRKGLKQFPECARAI